MRYIDPHAHMTVRTPDDYARLALTGCIAIGEPTFAMGGEPASVAGVIAGFRRLTELEPRRADRHGIRHFAWLCLDPARAEDRQLALATVARLPRFLEHPTVVGIGETGLVRGTRNELETFRDHLDLAIDHRQLLLVRPPQLQEKHPGTRRLLDLLSRDGRVDPGRVLIDHAEEHTLAMILDRGFWAGITLHPRTMATPERAVDMIERFGPDRICIASGCDASSGSPTAVPRFALAMRRRGHPEALVRRIVLENPAAFLHQCPKVRIDRDPVTDRGHAAPADDPRETAAEPVAAGRGG